MAAREVLLVVATLTILFGLVVSLARRVRAEAAFSLVRREMLVLEDALAAYLRREQSIPNVPPLFPAEMDREITASTPGFDSSAAPDFLLPNVPARLTDPHDERILAERAFLNNRATIGALDVGARRSAITQRETRAGDAENDADAVINGVSALLFDGSTLRDPWGQPIVFMSAGRAEIGYATKNRPFFFSAGPDGRYLTLLDNIYSYEVRAGRIADPGDDPAEDPAIPQFPTGEE